MLRLIPPDLVRAIHDAVLNPGELTGEALDKSLEGALARVDHRLAYGMIDDAFDLAAAYCVALAAGYCFNDGNKRTAFQVMDVALDVNGVQIDWDSVEIGQMAISVAQRRVEAGDLAQWLRDKNSNR